MRFTFSFLFFVLMFFHGISVHAQKDTVITAAIQGHVFKPAKAPATDKAVGALKVAQGLKFEKFAENLGQPRMMEVLDDGTVYVTRREGDIMMLKDTDGDGKANEQQQVLKMKGVHGLARDGNTLYIVAVNNAFKADINADGTLQQPDTLLKNLPDGGQHPNRTMAFGPDGQLYLSVGSTCNACDETNPENATLLVVNPVTGERRIFAKGLRNTIGFDWHPATGQLAGLDHGIDWLGDTVQKEEVNLLVDGAHYGWPYIYGEKKYNPADAPPGDMTWKEFATKTIAPVYQLTAHSAPLDMIFYRGDALPEGYHNNALITLHGSWNRKQPVGYKLVRLTFEEDGTPSGTEDVVTGFLAPDGRSQMGRVCGLIEMPDGSVLVSDDSNGVIYRLSAR